MLFEMELSPDVFKIEHEFKREDFAPGVWAGTEGLKLTVTNVDFEKRTITLEYINDSVVSDSNNK